MDPILIGSEGKAHFSLSMKFNEISPSHNFWKVVGVTLDLN